MNNKRLIISLIATLFFSITTIASEPGRDPGYGGGLIYNFNSKGIGLDLRMDYPLAIDLLDGVSIVPQIAYYPWFNDKHELFLGTSIHVNVYTYKRWQFYPLANLSFNAWFNHEEAADSTTSFSNGSFELGAGVSYIGCIKPFFEYRHRLEWNENSIRLGVVYYFDCKMKGMVPCSKIPPPPEF